MMKQSIFLLTLIIAVSCGKNNDVPPPEKATLVFPAQNSACISGVVVSAAESVIVFSWNAGNHTDSYELVIKNLLTQTTVSQVVTTNRDTVTLLRNTPYSWYVNARSNSTSTVMQSDTWKFYNAGAGTTSYAPFPASITAPAFGQNIQAAEGRVRLEWIGSDVDNDIAGYDIYFGTGSTATVLKRGIRNMFLDSVPVISNATYYWKVITHDVRGNTSVSDVFRFKVE